jgi:hypothetical protein
MSLWFKPTAHYSRYGQNDNQILNEMLINNCFDRNDSRTLIYSHVYLDPTMPNPCTKPKNPIALRTWSVCPQFIAPEPTETNATTGQTPPCLSILMGGIHCSYISTLENDWQANGKKLRSFARTSVCSANKQTTVNLPMPGPPLLSGNHTADKGSQLPLRPSSYLYDGHTHKPHTGKDFRNKR